MASYAIEIVIMVSSIYFAWVASQMGIGSLRDPGAGFWPLTICLTILVLSFVAGIQSFIAKVRVAFNREEMRNPMLAIISIFLYALTIGYVGYLLPTMALMLFWLRVIGRESWKLSALMGIFITTLFYLVFSFLLGVPFPTEILMELFE